MLKILIAATLGIFIVFGAAIAWRVWSSHEATESAESTDTDRVQHGCMINGNLVQWKIVEPRVIALDNWPIKIVPKQVPGSKTEENQSGIINFYLLIGEVPKFRYPTLASAQSAGCKAVGGKVI